MLVLGSCCSGPWQNVPTVPALVNCRYGWGCTFALIMCANLHPLADLRRRHEGSAAFYWRSSGRFLPCGIGAHHCRLRHLGWEKCGHGLTSRPRETSDPGFLDSILGVFGYPAVSGRVLLDGCLPLRYYNGSFALRKPTWKLPERGEVCSLVAASSPSDGQQCSGQGECWTRGAGGAWKRVRLTKKTASSLVRRHGEIHALNGKRWKRLHVSEEGLGSGDGSSKRGRFLLQGQGDFPREGVG